jgi:hypothetical protein
MDAYTCTGIEQCSNTITIESVVPSSQASSLIYLSFPTICCLAELSTIIYISCGYDALERDVRYYNWDDDHFTRLHTLHCITASCLYFLYHHNYKYPTLIRLFFHVSHINILTFKLLCIIITQYMQILESSIYTQHILSFYCM